MAQEKKFVFSVVPKQTSSPFFDEVYKGCADRAAKLGNIVCHYNGTEFANVAGQAEIIRQLVADKVDGIAVAILEAESPITRAAIAHARKSGIPVVTFDSDDPGSERLTYIGTDNYKFGRAMGKVLLQIDPTGGYYGVITTRAGNAVERERGLKDRLQGSKWIEHATSPGDCKEDHVLGIQKMREFSAFPEVRAILPIGGWPMRKTDLWEHFIDDFPNMTTVGGDALPHQMDLMNKGYVTGLVGQVPFRMGSDSVKILLQHIRGEAVPKTRFGTTLQEIVSVPLDLEPPNVNNHYIGNLKYIGFSLAGLVVLLSIGFATWTYKNRGRRVVKASQPAFLIMIAAGTALMGVSIVPMSFDDENMPLDAQNPCMITCMSAVWLFSVGFTTAFSALYSKTWRVNRIFHNPNKFTRIKVTQTDALGPFALLLLANVLTLSLFTFLAPLEFVRQPHEGTDDWNRVISTYGTCQSTNDHGGGAQPYYFVLATINFGVLCVANWQAYQARSIQSEFSESKWIGICMASLLQSFVMAVPILFLVRDSPEVFYLLRVSMVFVICTVILLGIFLPKVARLSESQNHDFSIQLPAGSVLSTGQNPESPRKASTSRSNESVTSGLKFTISSVVPPEL